MQILAKQTIIYNSKRYKPGTVFEIDEIEGKALIQQRFAVSAENEAEVAATTAEVAATDDGPVQTIGADTAADDTAPVQTARKAK